MSIFGKKPTSTESTPKPELSIELNGCKIEGTIVRDLMDNFYRRNPEDLQELLSNIFQELGITTTLEVYGNKILTADGKTISYSGQSSSICGPRYPHIGISTNNTRASYAIKNGEIFPHFFECKQDKKSLTFYFPSSENYNKPSIRISEGNWLLNIDTIEEVTRIERSPEMEKELLALEFSDALTPNAIYKIVRKYINLPIRIDLGWTSGIFNYYIWKIRIIDGKCVSYMENTLSESKNDYVVKTEVDLVNNYFRYETPNLEYSFHNEKFNFTTNSQAFEEDFVSCKAEITAFKDKMKHILD